jgi:TRAP-type C4-dicarboxylate transport system substrate-binding protein
MESPLYIKLVKSLGGNPTPVAWPEAYTAVQQGVVDGLELPVGSIIMVKFYEVTKYVVLDGHVFSTDFMLINERAYQKLSKDIQKIIREAAIAGATAGRAIEALNSSVGIEKLKELGMEVYGPTAEELSLFRKASQEPVVKWLRQELAEDAVWVDKVFEAVKKARGEI